MLLVLYYLSMRKDKKKIIQLRESGKSYSELEKMFRVPRSTLSSWFQSSEWSQQIRQKLAAAAVQKSTVRIQYLNNLRGQRLHDVYKSARREAFDEYNDLKCTPLFIASMAIYWGEGDQRTKNTVRLGNADVSMMRVFVSFLHEICGIPKNKIYAWILVYPDLVVEDCENFWAYGTGLSIENFTKTIVAKGKHKTRRVQHGIGYVGVNSSYLKEKMKVWLDLYKSDLERECSMRA